ncbi:MAG: dUTP diphosphatase [Alphaproteobacteria bacterium]|nr:dUTP diphosphatase [Alphaproteobacteria bacterium]
MVPTLYISRTPDGEGLPLPSYESKNHIALTLQAAISIPVRLKAGERAYVPVGFAIGIPNGFCGQVVSLPKLARADGIVVSDAPHILHPADRNPLFVLLRNTSENDFVLHRGVVCAQLVIFPAVQVTWKELERHVNSSLTSTDEILLDEAEEEVVDAMAPSARREVRSIRNRYKKNEE